MDWSEEDQQVAGGHSEGLEGPTSETPLKGTGLPPSSPSPPIDGRTLSDPEAWTRWLRNMAEYMQQYNAMPEVKARRAEYMNQAERMKQYRACLLYTSDAADE